MLIKVDNTKIDRYHQLCKAEHVFGSRSRSALAAYGTEHDVHKFWIMAEGNKDLAALHLNGQVLTVVKSGHIGTEDIIALTKEFEIHKIYW